MPPPFMPPPDRADLERLLRLGLSLRQAAGALRVHLDAALAAIDKGRAVNIAKPPPAPQRRPVVRRGKAVEGAVNGNGKARAIAAG
jgi:hypothetical protein